MLSFGRMNASDSLTSLARSYITREHLSPAYASQILARCHRFEQWASREVSPQVLAASPTLLSAFLVHLEQLGLSGTTVRGYRACILAVSHDALGNTGLGANVRRVRRKQGNPVAWTAEEIRALLRVATTARGATADGIPFKLYWPALIHFGYSTGQRLADLLACNRTDISKNGVWTCTQNKTGNIVTLRLSADALNYGRRLPSDRVHWVPWPYSVEMLRRRFARLVADAQIRPGSFKWLRRSAGSHYEKENPGAGHRLLGNTRAIFDESYHDRSLTQQPLTAPPLGND
ncbi:Phage integrase family protein [Aeoliella mucimassa]|uniref:Phage integrase family protein n=1 Tax=Aeoliella mucimassa TaxID=2527972 RepID=A0A518AUC8_9BACT|nr:Phage integrase family protein [Aeoliella mucimassa]